MSNNANSENGYLRSDNAFGSVRHVVLDELFKGASIRASFGGTVIDLRHTHLAPGETTIDIDCTCSGIELYIPSDWNVLPQCNAFAGGCEDKRWQGANINKEKYINNPWKHFLRRIRRKKNLKDCNLNIPYVGWMCNHQ